MKQVSYLTTMKLWINSPNVFPVTLQNPVLGCSNYLKIDSYIVCQWYCCIIVTADWLLVVDCATRSFGLRKLVWFVCTVCLKTQRDCWRYKYGSSCCTMSISSGKFAPSLVLSNRKSMWATKYWSLLFIGGFWPLYLLIVRFFSLSTFMYCFSVMYGISKRFKNSDKVTRSPLESISLPPPLFQ